MAHDTEVARFSKEDAAALTRIESTRKPSAEWLNRPDSADDGGSSRRFAIAIVGLAAAAVITATAALDQALPQPGGALAVGPSAPVALVGTDAELGMPFRGLLPAAVAAEPLAAPVHPTVYLPAEIPVQAPEVPDAQPPTF